MTVGAWIYYEDGVAGNFIVSLQTEEVGNNGE
jgi:hypothetical protein